MVINCAMDPRSLIDDDSLVMMRDPIPILSSGSSTHTNKYDLIMQETHGGFLMRV